MPISSATAFVHEWSRRLRADSLVSRVIVNLRGHADEIWHSAFDALQRDCSEYHNSVDENFARESKSHCGELLRFIVSIPGGQLDDVGSDPFRFVRAHAEWRFRHNVPLVASLQAYRIAHKTYWEMTRKALLKHARKDEAIASLTTLADFLLEVFDVVGNALAEAHAVEQKLVNAYNARLHVAIVEDLLSGLFPTDAEAQRICALSGIRQSEHMAVVVARLTSVEEAEVDFEVMLRSLAKRVERSLPSSIFGKLVDIRNSEVTGVISSDADTAARAVKALRKMDVKKDASENVGLAVGISLDVTDIAKLPQAYEEARIAMDFTNRTRPVMQFRDIELSEFIIRGVDPAAYRLIPGWARHFSDPNDEKTRDLLCTIRAFADSSLNVKQTARLLGVHTNTVYFRLNRITKLTGVDPRTYTGTSMLTTVLRLLECGRHESQQHLIRTNVQSRGRPSD